MKLSLEELKYIRSMGLFIREKCDSCGKVLNQTVRYTIKDLPSVYCSAECRDIVFQGQKLPATKKSTLTHIPHEVLTNASTRAKSHSIRTR